MLPTVELLAQNHTSVIVIQAALAFSLTNGSQGGDGCGRQHANVAILLPYATVTACESQVNDCIIDTATTHFLLTTDDLHLALLVIDFQGIQHRFDHEVSTLYKEQAS